MYSYTKKKRHVKKYVVSSMFVLLAAAVLGVSYLVGDVDDADNTPVISDDGNVPVITIPKVEEKAIRPYTVEASVVLDYYDGTESEIDNMTKFEGTYRANQGIDYGFNEEAFDVVAILSGEVSEVKEDPLFGYSCTITSGDVRITYQSLEDMKKVVGDKITQGDVLSLASSNIYNKELGKHVHIVAEKNGVRIDPESIYEKTVVEIK